ncbi:MAG: NAD-dependent DNA ligase LigA [Puniceicoccales bacterium]|jgi:DNA ligase (NAD+)|nr:NAD-dependent DNA ligase LigA [Puniceicoccales bacterium]
MVSNITKTYSISEIRTLEAKYDKLLSEVSLHDRLYYRENSPRISDFEYDCLKSEVERLREILTVYSVETRDTPIGDDRNSGFQSFAHLSPMMSLSNTYSREELVHFSNHLGVTLGQRKFSYVIEPKIDGIAVNLIYRRGKFFRALTRGNGMVGDDVSANIKTIRSLPLEIENDAEAIEIRGEVYMDKQTFVEINKTREEQELELFANPRNLAAGTLKTLDIHEVAERDLKLITYAIGHCSEKIVSLQSEVLELLKNLGFASQEKYWIAENIEEAWKCIEELNEMRHVFPYWTDGVVLKINELQLYGILGATAKSPRWAIAYKFAPERATTKIKNIILQVGRTGIITPVADLENVQLSGTNVSRATLHNADEISKKDIRVGDYVTVEKAGEIIPAIVAVDRERRNVDSIPFVFPKTCPSCGSQLIRLPGEVARRCQNLCCLPQIQRRLEHFVSRTAMDIDGLGTAIIEKLMAVKKLNNIADIYRLTFNDLECLEKFGTKSALKILSNIDNSKNRPLWRLLHGFGILGIGEQTAKILASHFHSLDNLIAATPEELEQLSGIGIKLSNAIVAFFREQHNGNILNDLRMLGVIPGDRHLEISQNRNSKFYAKNFVLTGTLSSLTRQEAIEKIEHLGGNVANAISGRVNILIAGKNCGSKLEKAQSLGLEIWNEIDLLENLNGVVA